MGNPISKQMMVGTIGEILVQLRLLQYGVQAAPPIKDSGNDLIAVKGESFRGIQVKTTATWKFHWNNLKEHYHILALVGLSGDDDQLFLDQSDIYLVPRDDVEHLKTDDLGQYLITQGHVDELFQ